MVPTPPTTCPRAPGASSPLCRTCPLLPRLPSASDAPLFYFQVAPDHELIILASGAVRIILPDATLDYPSLFAARLDWPDARPAAYGVEEVITQQLLLIDPPHLPAPPLSSAVARWLIHYHLRQVRRLQRQGCPLLPPDLPLF